MFSAWGASHNKSVTFVKAPKTDERWIADETGRTLIKWMQTYSKDTADSKHKQFYRTWKRSWTVAMIGKYAIMILGLYCRMKHFTVSFCRECDLDGSNMRIFGQG